MAFPARLLNDGEEVVVELRPHWVYLGWPLVATIAAVALAIGVTVAVSNPPGWTGAVLLVPVAAAGLWLLGRSLRRRAATVVLTTARIVQRTGVLSRSVTDLRLDRVDRLSSHQSMLGRLGGWGEVVVEVGGEQGVVVFERLPRPTAVVGVVTQQIDALAPRQNHPPAWPGPQTPPAGTPTPSITQQLVELDELRRRGILTEEEFGAKKAELLRRM